MSQRHTPRRGFTYHLQVANVRERYKSGAITLAQAEAEIDILTWSGKRRPQGRST